MPNVGIGTIRIKVLDGMVRDLTYVRYVTQIKSIILVRAVESKRLIVTKENGTLKSTKGSFVLMKSVRE